MSENNKPTDAAKRPGLTRRDFIKLGGGLLGAAAGSAWLSKALLKPEVAQASTSVGAQARPASAISPAQAAEDPPDLHLVASDGWMYLPADAPVPPFHPDTMAPPVTSCAA